MRGQISVIDSCVGTKVNDLVNGIFPVLSVENGCLVIDLCQSSPMSTDQKPIKNRLVSLAIRSWRDRAEIDGGKREHETAKTETARERAIQRNRQNQL